MPVYAAMATGNYGTAATWNRGANAATINASTNVTLSTTPQLGATFTAPNTTNAVTGVMIYYVGTSGATTITATLTESGVDTAHTQTITLSNVNTNSWIFFVPTTPYTYTTTAANAYRWKFVTDTSTATVAQSTTASVLSTISYDNRTGPPVSGDNAYIVSPNDTTTPLIVTMNGTQTVGPNSTSPTSSRTVAPTIIVGKNAQLQMDTTATSQLTVRGNSFVDNGGEWSCGTVASPLSSSYTSTIIASTSNSTINYANGAKGIWQGSPKTYQKTTVSSGAGTTADPLITTDPVDWVVGDRVIISPASDSATNYNETEEKYIRVKNSSTSYTLADTAGGAESGLTNSHNGALIGNFTNNVVIRGNSSTVFIGFVAAAQTSSGNINIDWVRFENLTANAFLGVIPTASVVMGQNCQIDNSVAINGSAGLFFLSATTDMTFSNLLTYNTLTTTALLPSFANIALYGGTRTTLDDCHSFASNGYGIGLDTTFSSTVVDSSAYACNNSTISSAGIGYTASGLNSFTRVESHAHYNNAVYIASGPSNTFIDCLFGTKGDMPDSVYMGTGYSTAIFNDCTFDTTDLIQNYANMTLGSEIRFNRIDDTDNNHRWYTVYGYGASESSVIRSPGLSVKLVPENLATGFTWQFQIPVVQNSIAGFRGYFLKNATLGTSVVTISMYLPGNPVAGGSPDATVTLDNTTGSAFTDADEQYVSLTANYEGDIPGAAEIVINVKSNTAGAALYADDFFNAGDRTTTFDSITGLNLWVDGKPLSVISPSVPSADDTAAAVWGYLKTNMTTNGTAGKTLIDGADSAELASIK